jgi:hypothetical protein
MRRSVAQASVSYCRNCERFLAPPAQWMIARPESHELLAICLKKLKGLNRVRLTDAHFIWTEPHSKRLKISLTIQKEVCCPLKLLFRSTQSKITGIDFNNSRTSVRDRVFGSARTVSRLYEAGREKYLEGPCSSSAESSAQADVLVP